MVSKFFNPAKSDSSLLLIKYYAKTGIEKELKKLNKQIEKASEKLRLAYNNNASRRRILSMRLNLDAKCERRDALERALEVLETRTDIFKAQ